MLDATATSPTPSRRRARAAGADPSGLGFVLILLLIVLSLTVPSFLSIRNISGLALSITLIGTIAPSMALVLALGEVDLSVASIVAFAGVVASLATTATNSVVLGVISGVLAGGVVGVFNGIVTANLGVNSLITTLASMEAVRGLAYIAAHGDAVLIRDERFFRIGASSLFGVTIPVWVMLATFVLCGVVLNMTVLGRNILAIGGNAEAARLAGVRVRSIKILAFALQGVIAGLAGVILASRLSLGDPKTSVGLELGVISACVLGGASLTGGVATIVGVAIGVLIMGCVQDAMGLLNIPTFYQYLVRGTILLLAVLFDRWKQTRR